MAENSTIYSGLNGSWFLACQKFFLAHDFLDFEVSIRAGSGAA